MIGDDCSNVNKRFFCFGNTILYMNSKQINNTYAKGIILSIFDTDEIEYNNF